MRVDGRVASIESRPWRVDPIPMVIDTATFRWLSRAVADRMRSLDAVIADLYGAAHSGGRPDRARRGARIHRPLPRQRRRCIAASMADHVRRRSRPRRRRGVVRRPGSHRRAARDRIRPPRPLGDVAGRAGRDGTARDRLDRPLHGVDAPGVGGDLTGREPAHRRVLGRARPPVVRRSLLPGGAARRAPGRRRRPGRATAAGVAAHARRARAGRRPVPEVGGPDGRPARGRCSRRARRSRPAAGGQVGRRRTRQRPRGRGGGGARRVGLRRRRDRAAAPDGAVAPASARPVGTVGDGADRACSRAYRAFRRLSCCGCSPSTTGSTSPCYRAEPAGCWRRATIRGVRRRASPRTCGCSAARWRRSSGRACRRSTSDGRCPPAPPTRCIGPIALRSGRRRWRAPLASSPRVSSRTPAWH